MPDLAETIRASSIALVALVVVSVAAVAVLSGRRVRAGAAPRAATARSAIDVGLFAMIIAVLLVTFAPTGQYEARQLHLLPFADFVSTASSQGVLDAASQAIANVALFVPLGFLVPARWRRLDGWARVLGATACFSAAIEVLQFALGSGHTSSIDDVVWNTLGGLLGYSLLRGFRHIRRRSTSRPRASLGRASG